MPADPTMPADRESPADPAEGITYLYDDDGRARFVQIDIDHFGAERVDRLVAALHAERLRAACHALIDALPDDALPHVLAALQRLALPSSP